MPEKLSSHDYGCSLGLKDLFFGHHCRFQYSQHPCQGLVGSSWIFSATALIHFRHWQRASGQEGVVWFLTCLQQECWLDVMAFISETGITWKIYIDRYIYIYIIKLKYPILATTMVIDFVSVTYDITKWHVSSDEGSVDPEIRPALTPCTQKTSCGCVCHETNRPLVSIGSLWSLCCLND